MKSLNELELKNKIVFLRVDFNVPVKNGVVLDYTRIDKIVPTINYLLKKKARVILASHFGRPKNGFEEKYSLRFLVKELENILGQAVTFSDLDKAINFRTSSVKVHLLENLRFYPGEVENSSEFAKQLASIADAYINDAFSCCHRAHASIAKITEFLPSAAGLLLQDEIDNLDFYLANSAQPMMAIIGGSKVSTKIDLIESLAKQAEYIFIGGAMANTFLKAKNFDIGSSFYEPQLLKKAKEILEYKHCRIILPEDFIVASEISDSAKTRVISKEDAIESNEMMLDIGPKTVNMISDIVLGCKTVVMNGPLGVFEYQPFKQGSFAVAKKIAELTQLNNLQSIAGGGDVVAAISQAGVFNQFSYISTAGGAFLEWLEGKKLPGLVALESE
jgi:phosphoglycerate kinase